MVERLFLAVPRACLRFVIVVFRDHTLLLFLGILLHYVAVHMVLKSDFLKRFNIGQFLPFCHALYSINLKYACALTLKWPLMVSSRSFFSFV